MVSLSSHFPPYTIDHAKKTGIDPELLSTIMRRAGYEVEFITTPSKRQNSVIQRLDVDAATVWVMNSAVDCYMSKPYRYWLNVLIVPDNSDIKELKDLEGKRLIIFHDAEQHIDNLADISELVVLLLESESSLQAARMLRADRADAYVGDYTGYYYALQSEYGKEEAERLTNIKHYFNSMPQKICFKDKQIRDDFDQALSELIDENIFQQIYDKYSPGISAHFFSDRENSPE
jgi:hypothetical protein